MPKSIHSEPYKYLCKLLIERRKELGLSQYALADVLHRSQSYVAKIEGGERRIDVVELIEIASVLNIDPCEILRKVEALQRNQQA